MDNRNTIAGQAAQLEPGNFRGWLQQRQKAVDEILDTVADTVEKEALEPVAGARIVACVTGSAFGYEEFHPRTGQPTAELMLDSDLIAGIRQPASTR